MSVATSAFSLLIECINELANQARSTFIAALVIGLVLGALCWWGCSALARQCNLRSHRFPWHHVLCTLAAMVTLASSVGFAALGFTKEVARASILAWRAGIEDDGVWSDETFRMSYENVYDLGVEDFTNYPHPDDGGSLVPSTTEESKLTSASTYAEAAIRHFGDERPYLSLILWGDSTISREIIKSDMDQWFLKNQGGTYQLSRAIDRAAEETQRQLELQAPRVVTVSRMVLILAFFVFQAIPFLTIYFVAQSTIKKF